MSCWTSFSSCGPSGDSTAWFKAVSSASRCWTTTTFPVSAGSMRKSASTWPRRPCKRKNAVAPAPMRVSSRAVVRSQRTKSEGRAI